MYSKYISFATSLLGIPVNAEIESMAATPFIQACRHGQGGLEIFKPIIRMSEPVEKKGDLSRFKRGIVVGVRWAVLCTSETAGIFPHTNFQGLQRLVQKKEKISSQFSGRKSAVDARGHTTMAILFWEGSSHINNHLL